MKNIIMLNKINRLIEDKKTLNLIKNITMTFGVKGIAMIVSFVNMPLFMRYFPDQSVLGLWFSLVSILSWVLSFDFGIGHGLRNLLVSAIEQQDRGKVERLICSAYYSIGILVACFSVLIGIVSKVVDWNHFFNISAEIISSTILRKSISLLLVGLLIQFFLKIVTAILYALQKPAVPNFLLLISNILLLLATVFLNTNNCEANLLLLSKAYVITSNIPYVIVTLIVFKVWLKDVKIIGGDFSRREASKILTLGTSFFVLQIMSLIAFNTREFFVMRLVNPAEVVPYQIYNKLFSLVSTFFSLALTPVWSAITQAVAQKDYVWIKKTYRLAKLIMAFFVACNLCMIVVAQFVVRIWLGDNAISIELLPALLFVLYNVEFMWINLHCNFENGMGKLDVQKIGFLIACVAFPIMSIVLSYWKETWTSVVVANSFAVFPMCILQYLEIKRVLKQTK